MQRLLDQAVHHASECPVSVPPPAAWVCPLGAPPGMYCPPVALALIVGQCSLQMVFELGNPNAIDSGCAFVLNHPLYAIIRLPRSTHDVHQSACPASTPLSSADRSSCQSRRPAPALGASARLLQLRVSTRLGSSAFIDCPSSSRGPTRVSFMFGPSVVAHLLWPLLTSARPRPAPFDAGSSIGHRPEISPGIAHPPSRLCLSDIRPQRSVQVSGFNDIWPPYPAASPHIRFLFVRPALCLQLPSDSQSPATPLPFG